MEEEMQEQTQAVTEESVVAQTSADAVPESDAEAAGGGNA